MVWILGFITLAGYNFTLWAFIGVIRYLFEKIHSPKLTAKKPEMQVHDVAAIIPAHNEEQSIRKTLHALLRVLPPKNIYVASDYSTDRTVEIIRNMGVRSLDIKPNRGKARSLVWIMNQYGLLNAYKLILINDADTEMDENYLTRALPLFNDKEIACVAPHGVTHWRELKFWETFFIAYRIRLWRYIQIGIRYGMTWKFTNMTYIVPGSLSLYRASVLKQLEIDAPGLVIEDFNMTFEVHKKKLGKVAYQPNIIGVHQDPHNFRDYTRQVERWNLGFWQTVRRHGIWPSLFCFSTLAFSLELLFYSFFILQLPILLLFFFLNSFQPLTVPFIQTQLHFTDVLLGIFFTDYVLTIAVAVMERKPVMLLYGLGFIFLRYVDAMIFVSTPIIAFTTRSNGLWTSPKRL